jgi:hypothetical protein
VNKTIAILTVVGCLALCQSAAQAAEITFAAYTNGCLGVGCTPLNTSALGEVAIRDLTYSNTTFEGMSSSGALGVNLGSFDLEPDGNDNYAGGAFNLRITFTAPSGIAGGSTSTFTSVLSGTTSGGPGPVQSQRRAVRRGDHQLRQRAVAVQLRDRGYVGIVLVQRERSDGSGE